MPGAVVEDIEAEKKFLDEPVVEDVKEDEEHDDDVDDSDDEDDEKDDGTLGGNESSKQSRSEKKCGKAMLKLGMKAVFGENQKCTVFHLETRCLQEPKF